MAHHGLKGYSDAGAGDVNIDGTLNVLDVVSLSANILGIVEFSEDQELNADFNFDGSINVLDVVALVNEILDPTIFTWTLQDINPSHLSSSPNLHREP